MIIDGGRWGGGEVFLGEIKTIFAKSQEKPIRLVARSPSEINKFRGLGRGILAKLYPGVDVGGEKRFFLPPCAAAATVFSFFSGKFKFSLGGLFSSPKLA